MASSGSNWLEVQDFIKTHYQLDEKVIAPAQFGHELPGAACSYEMSYVRGAEQFQWVVIHKGRMDRIHRPFLRQVVQKFQPVLANSVFVIFAKRLDLPKIESPSAQIQPLLERIAQSHQPPNRRVKLLRIWQKSSPEQPELPDPDMADLLRQSELALRWIDRLDREVKSLKQLIASQRPSVTLSALGMENLTLQQFLEVCQAATQTTYLGDHTILCWVLSQYLLYGDTRDAGIMPHLCMRGYWEAGVTMTMGRAIRPGWCCLDVGANVGYYTLLMASLVGQSGQVIALEANDRLVELLGQTLGVNALKKRVTLVHKAVSDRDGETVQLSAPINQPGGGSIMLSPGQSPDGYCFEVETITIDTLMQGRPVNLIKIDVEGAELKVWQGMQQTVRNNPEIIIILEFGANRYADSRAFLQSILDAGFILRYVEYDEVKDLTIERCLTERPASHWELFLSRR